MLSASIYIYALLEHICFKSNQYCLTQNIGDNYSDYYECTKEANEAVVKSFYAAAPNIEMLYKEFIKEKFLDDNTVVTISSEFIIKKDLIQIYKYNINSLTSERTEIYGCLLGAFQLAAIRLPGIIKTEFPF